MATSYPTSKQIFTNPDASSGDTLDSPPHDDQHADVNDTVEALQDKVGIGTGTPSANAFFVGDGAGSSGWQAPSTARTNLGVAIGSDVQAYSSNLDDFSGKSAPTGDVVGTTDTQTLTNKTINPSNNTITGINSAGSIAINKSTVANGALDVNGDIYSSGEKVVTPSDTRLLDHNVLDGSYSNSTSTSSEWTNSRLSCSVPYDNASVEIHLDLSLRMDNSSWAQGVVELWHYDGSTDTFLTRKVPVTANTAYAQANISYCLTGLSSGTHEFYILARTSTGASNIYDDPTATNTIWAKLV